MAYTTDNSVMTELPEIPQETLDSLILTPEAKAHYSQENEIKRLLIERETYKRAYESQQKSINEFAKKWDEIMEMPVSTRTWTMTNLDGTRNKFRVTQTFRDYVRDEYYKNVVKTIRFDYKIGNEIEYFKNYKFV
jgi:hypothetical protein